MPLKSLKRNTSITQESLRTACFLFIAMVCPKQGHGGVEFLPIPTSQIPPRRAGLTHSSGPTVDRLHGRHILKSLQCRVIGSCAKGSFVFALALDPNSRNKKSYCLRGPIAMSSGSRVSIRMKLDKINRQELTIGHSLLSLWPLTLFRVSHGREI